MEKAWIFSIHHSAFITLHSSGTRSGWTADPGVDDARSTRASPSLLHLEFSALRFMLSSHHSAFVPRHASDSSFQRSTFNVRRSTFPQASSRSGIQPAPHAQPVHADGHMQINLRRRDLLMPQQILDKLKERGRPARTPPHPAGSARPSLPRRGRRGCRSPSSSRPRGRARSGWSASPSRPPAGAWQRRA